MATPSGKRGESCMDAGIVSRDRKSVPDVPAFDRRTEGRHVQTATGSLSSESRRLRRDACALGYRVLAPVWDRRLGLEPWTAHFLFLHMMFHRMAGCRPGTVEPWP